MVAARAARFDGDARHAAHGVVQAQQILVVQLLARQHGDGLGNLAQALPALADADRLRHIRLRQLGISRRLLARADGDFRQSRHLARGGGRRTDDDAVAVDGSGQAAAGQQALQAVGHAQRAADGGRRLASHQFGCEQQLQIGLPRQFIQRLSQRLGGDGQLDGGRRLRLCLGDAAQGQHGGQGEGSGYQIEAGGPHVAFLQVNLVSINLVDAAVRQILTCECELFSFILQAAASQGLAPALLPPCGSR